MYDSFKNDYHVWVRSSSSAEEKQGLIFVSESSGDRIHGGRVARARLFRNFDIFFRRKSPTASGAAFTTLHLCTKFGVFISDV
jgi:hypothetical protein